MRATGCSHFGVQRGDLRSSLAHLGRDPQRCFLSMLLIEDHEISVLNEEPSQRVSVKQLHTHTLTNIYTYILSHTHTDTDMYIQTCYTDIHR